MPKHEPDSGTDAERYEADYNYLRDEYRLYGRYVANAGLAPRRLGQWAPTGCV